MPLLEPNYKAVVDLGGLVTPLAHTHTHTHTHTFNGPLSATTRVGRYQKGKTNLDFTEARDSERQLGHMQVCTSLQTDNHASTQQAATQNFKNKVHDSDKFRPSSTFEPCTSTVVCLSTTFHHHHLHFICPIIQQYAHLHRYNFRRARQQGE